VLEQILAQDQSAPSPRLVSLDTYRGLVMCLLAINGLAVAATAKKLGFGPTEEVSTWQGQIWQWLAFHNSHPSWNSQFYVVGCALWDLIQPAFMFMVGVAMPYSYASRVKRGHSHGQLTWHALLRAVMLVLIGVYLQTRNSGLETNRLFTNVLAQIGLGYFFVFLLLGRSARTQVAVGMSVLLVYTLWLLSFTAVDPLPPAALESIQSLHLPNVFAEKLAITANGASNADVKLLNALVGGDVPIEAHRAGYTTLNFIPSAVTMLIGVLVGTLLRSDQVEKQKLQWMFFGGAAMLGVAVVASFTICPVVKKIWTPSWVLFSGAYVVWLQAFLYWVVDVKGYRRWTFPFVVVGVNSLAMYLMSMLFKSAISSQLPKYLGKDVFAGNYGPMLQAICVFVVLWLLCYYCFRNKIFFRL
jgi:predicted acyltransferase